MALQKNDPTTETFDDLLRLMFVIGLFTIILVAILSIIAIFIYIFKLRTNVHQTKAETKCSSCRSENMTFLSTPKHCKTNTYGIIKFNLITILIYIAINIILFVLTIFNVSEGFEIANFFFLYSQDLSLIEITNIFESIIYCYTTTKAMIFLLIVNIILHFTIGFKKQYVITSVCKECGKISNPIDYKND